MRRTDRFRLIDAVSGAGLVVDAAGAPVDGPAAAELLLVPADRVASVVVELPGMSAGRMQQALRWAIEDVIAGDAERQHAVPLQRLDAERLRCLVVARDDVDGWRAQRPGAAQRIVPDAACLPWQEGRIVLMADGDSVLVRHGRLAFDRLQRDLLDVVLPELEAGFETAPTRIWIGDDPPAWLDDGTLQRRPPPASKLALLAPEAVGDTGASANLARGDYAAAGRGPGVSAWRRLAVLAAAVLVLAVLAVQVETWLLARENARTAVRIETLADELFPNLGPLLRPRAQLERAAALARGGSGDQAVALVAALDPVFSGADAVVVETIDFVDGRLTLGLTTPGMDDLEAVQNQLAARGMAVEVGEVTLEGDEVRAALVLGESDS